MFSLIDALVARVGGRISGDDITVVDGKTFVNVDCIEISRNRISIVLKGGEWFPVNLTRPVVDTLLGVIEDDDVIQLRGTHLLTEIK